MKTMDIGWRWRSRTASLLARGGMVLALFGSAEVLGAESEYVCRVAAVESVAAGGKLVEPDPYYRGFNNRLFTVDRQSGRITGAVLANQGADKIILMHPGDEDQPLSLLTVWPGRTSTSFLQVAEYVQQQEKPFLAVEGINLFTGTCTGRIKLKGPQ